MNWSTPFLSFDRLNGTPTATTKLLTSELTKLREKNSKRITIMEQNFVKTIK
jgi:hypothetical protein